MYKKWVNRFTILFLVILVLVNILYIKDNVEALEKKGENLIRFHVLAHSDSKEDQELKLRVRDRVIGGIGKDLEGSQSIDETRGILLENLEKIREIAEEEIIAGGKNYRVRVLLGDYNFPTKRYGNVVFPAGIYEALRIEIGQARGQNWWCVMFPPLCFVDVKHGLTDNKTKEQLKQSLTEEEYYLVYSSVNENELPLQLKSKIFELFKSSKDQLSRLGSIF